MFDSSPATCSGCLFPSSSFIDSCQLRVDLVVRLLSGVILLRPVKAFFSLSTLILCFGG